MAGDLLRDVARRGPVLAVVAHPDDESFGLGAVLARLVEHGAVVRVVCFTHGEASTLGAGAGAALGEARGHELRAAAAVLGVRDVALHHLPDGGLAHLQPAVLDQIVTTCLGDAATLVVFDAGGVTAHDDHRAATASAMRIATSRGLAVLEWGVAPDVARRLNAELATTFVPLDGEGAVDVDVDRGTQLAAIACHDSQARDNPVLARRLVLTGPTDRVRFRTPAG